MNPPLLSGALQGAGRYILCARNTRTRTSPGLLMNIADLLAPDAVLPALKAQSRKQLLQELAARRHHLSFC